MSPLRILILGVLFYMAFRLIFGGRKRAAANDRSGKPGRGGEMPADDVLEEDPVCGRLVPRRQAIRLQSGKKARYFCSQECCDTYRRQNK